jgi:hypothetical protein
MPRRTGISGWTAIDTIDQEGRSGADNGIGAEAGAIVSNVALQAYGSGEAERATQFSELPDTLPVDFGESHAIILFH